jgi:hypothetical protein
MVGDYGFDILSLGACPFPENFSLAALLSRQLLRAMRPAAADTRCLGAAPPRSAGPALHRTASPLSRPARGVGISVACGFTRPGGALLTRSPAQQALTRRT